MTHERLLIGQQLEVTFGGESIFLNAEFDLLSTPSGLALFGASLLGLRRRQVPKRTPFLTSPASGEGLFRDNHAFFFPLPPNTRGGREGGFAVYLSNHL